ncbi:hypothetical protein [Shimazuella kribbensis]|uniref:CDI toxin immunity protein n=1 Tax=Shimazuella kribbensis TaxID=139808 RepID=UPI000407236E|nr:hypothetical protein [Shimazuella kribbensis]
MNREERKNKLHALLAQQQQKNERQQKKNMINELENQLLTVFADPKDFEILDEGLSDKVVEQFCDIFPITWNKINWGMKSVHQINVKIDDILEIPSTLTSIGFSILTPIYILWGYGDYPSIKTKWERISLEKINEIIWIGSDMYIFSPMQKYVVEFSHDDSIHIGWVN